MNGIFERAMSFDPRRFITNSTDAVHVKHDEVTKGTNMKRMISRFWRDEEGASAVEYALIAALLAVVLFTAATALGVDITGAFTAIGNSMPG